MRFKIFDVGFFIESAVVFAAIALENKNHHIGFGKRMVVVLLDGHDFFKNHLRIHSRIIRLGKTVAKHGSDERKRCVEHNIRMHDILDMSAGIEQINRSG